MNLQQRTTQWTVIFSFSLFADACLSSRQRGNTVQWSRNNMRIMPKLGSNGMRTWKAQIKTLYKWVWPREKEKVRKTVRLGSAWKVNRFNWVCWIFMLNWCLSRNSRQILWVRERMRIKLNCWLSWTIAYNKLRVLAQRILLSQFAKHVLNWLYLIQIWC